MFHTLLPARARSARKEPRTKPKPMPLPVAKWLLEHTKLPARDMRRIKVLNAKVGNETITPDEEAELDAILHTCLTLDILRVDALAATLKKPARHS